MPIIWDDKICKRIFTENCRLGGMPIMWEGARGFPVQVRKVRGSRKAGGGAGQVKHTECKEN